MNILSPWLHHKLQSVILQKLLNIVIIIALELKLQSFSFTMSSIPYHKMPSSSWLVPGGNRDQKKKLFLNKTFPMNSAIRRNLGGPLSEVFFANLSTVSQDQVGFLPKLTGPGQDLWVSPSDILINKVILKPPFTNRLNLARTHHWIMEVGDKYLNRIANMYAQELEEALTEKERIMSEASRLAIRKAVEENRDKMLQTNKVETNKVVEYLKQAFGEVIADVMDTMTEECTNKFQEHLLAMEESLNFELHAAVKAREEFLRREYLFHLDWQANLCFEEYERKLKQSQKEWLKLLDEAKDKFEHDLAAMKAAMESEHLNRLLELHLKHLWDCQASKRELQLVFKNWYMKEFKNEIISREFKIIDLEKSLEMKTKLAGKSDGKIKDLYNQFQKFITFALKERPGQAEFLLSLQLLLRHDWSELGKDSNQDEEQFLSEGELIAKSIVEYMLKNLLNEKEFEDILFGPKPVDQPEEDFVQEVEIERVANRALKVVGASASSAGSVEGFKNRRLESLRVIFRRHPSLVRFFQETRSNTASNLSLTSEISLH